MINFLLMELTDKQREGLGKTFLDVFKYLVVGLLISDFVAKAPAILKIFVPVAIIGFLVLGVILHK